MKGLT